MFSRHQAGWSSSQRTAPLASLPGKTSISRRLWTSTAAVIHILRRQGPWRRNKVSSNPKDSTVPTLSRSASSRASPHRFTSLDTVCQSQPSSSATPATVRPWPTCCVAHLAAREVNSARTGAIRGSCSVNDPTPHPASGHRHRRFHHTRSTARPKQA